MAKKIDWQGWLKAPAYILGSLVALGILMTALGFGWSTPGSRWDVHDVQHVEEKVILDEHFGKMDTAMAEMNDRHMEQQTLVESIVRGECIENPRENLERQGLISKCRELGIER